MAHPTLTNIGKITSTHGLKGAFKIFHYTNDTNGFLKYQEYFDHNNTPLGLEFISTKGKYIIATLPDIDSCELAETVRDTEIFVNINIDNTNESEFFFSELNNMDVINEANQKIGIVNNTDNFGAGDIIEIKFLNNKTAMYSFTKELFPKVDRNNKQITFTAPEAI